MDQLGFLDVLNLVSLVIQIQNQSNLVRLSDVQDEVHKAVSDIHSHLSKQDSKIDYILNLLQDRSDFR